MDEVGCGRRRLRALREKRNAPRMRQEFRVLRLDSNIKRTGQKILGEGGEKVP